MTRRLLAFGRLAAAGEGFAAGDELGAIRALDHEILDGLGSGASVGGAHDALETHLADLSRVIDTISAAADYPPRSQDAVISFGEPLSTTLFTAAARAAGLAAAPVAAASLIVTDDRFLRARPDRVQIESLAPSRITHHLQAGSVVIAEGFIGATSEGVPTTMGFEASDLTASLLGAALEATEIQIWTDVPGMLTTAHPAVADPRVVPRLSVDRPHAIPILVPMGDVAESVARLHAEIVAHPSDIVRMTVRKGLALAALGLPIGLVGAAFLTRFIQGLLYGVSTTDPVTYFGIPVVLVLATLAASYIPARRASRVDPLITLRNG